jgi:hypothetical protein
MSEGSKQAHFFVRIRVRDTLVGFAPLKLGFFHEGFWRMTESILNPESILARELPRPDYPTANQYRRRATIVSRIEASEPRFLLAKAQRADLGSPLTAHSACFAE